MRYLPVILIAGLVTSVVTLAEKSAPRKATAPAPTCETTYVGVVNGDLRNAANWTNGLPGPTRVACFPDDVNVGRVAETRQTVPMSGLMTRPTGQTALELEGKRVSGRAEARGSGIPSPTANGSCCLGATCQQTDSFDCRDLGGYFLEGVGPCTESVCATGACCTTDAACTDDDGAGGAVDEALCDILNGNFLGGATCGESDPCQRFRLPDGFEIVEVAPGTEALDRRWPRLNNCGEVVFNMRTDPSSGTTNRIFRYENGLLTQMVENGVVDVFPDINDEGTIVWVRGFDGFGGGEILMLGDGGATVLGPGISPRVNNRAHLVWQLREPDSCPARDAIHFYDGFSDRVLFDDGLSNQSPAINNHDEMVWTNYHFPCGGGFGDWTSEIMLYADGVVTVLPSVINTPQTPAIDNIGRVAWSDFDLVEIWQAGITTALTDGHIPALNDRGDVAFQRWMPGWQLCLYRNGVFYPISKPEDFDVPPYIDNGRPDINHAGEISWWWLPNGALTPSGTRFMRRIRNGDVNFDGVVDIDDFIPLPNCWTGPVKTDGLCECRFFDIDHDRDVDDDDFDLFMRVYTGPVEDCNDNSTSDLRDLIDGTSSDCNLNGIPDECDIADGTPDGDGDGVPDQCCVATTGVRTESVGATNRYLSITVNEWDVEPPLLASNGFVRHSPSPSQAVRVKCVDLPPPFDVWNGMELFVGEPFKLCENSGDGRDVVAPDDCGPAGPLSRAWFWAAPLQCQAHYTDWSAFDNVHVYHEGVIPGGTYAIQTIVDGCGLTFEGNYSPALSMTQAVWGDICSDGPGGVCTGVADGNPELIQDVLGLIDKFQNINALQKSRADLVPGDDGIHNGPDFKVTIIGDALFALDAFQGFAYPFTPGDPCGPG